MKKLIVNKGYKLATGLLFPTILFVALSAEATSQLYRYHNANGVPVIDDNVPPEYASKGYDIIRPDGTLIKRVPRQLSEEELRLHNTDESREQLRIEEEERMRAWDESLLLRYSDVSDIEAAESRALRDLNIRISILKSNLSSMKGQVEREQQKAADIERRGVDVPEEIVRNINTMRLEIEDIEQSIAVRREEVQSVKASYQRDIGRFETLIDRVNMRRKQSQSSSSSSKSYRY